MGGSCSATLFAASSHARGGVRGSCGEVNETVRKKGLPDDDDDDDDDDNPSMYFTAALLGRRGMWWGWWMFGGGWSVAAERADQAGAALGRPWARPWVGA